MKIVIIRSTSIFKDSRTSKWIAELLAQKHQVLVLGWDRLNEYDEQSEFVTPDGAAKIIFYKEICPYGGGIKNLFKQLRFQSWVKKQIKLLNYDYVIHACDYDAAKPAISVRGQRRFVYDIFDYFSESRNMSSLLKKLVKKSEDKIVNTADAVVICTEQRRGQIKECKPQNLFVVHNTPNLQIQDTCKIVRGQSDKLKVVYVGVLADKRLLKEIIDETPNHPNIELHIGGIGQYADYVKKLSQEQDNIIYYGSMKYGEVLALEKDCDVLFATYDPTVPNHKYSAPNKFYEACALGKPIIVCNNTGVDEMVKNSGCGIAINYSAQEFFDAVEKLDLDPNLRKQMSKNGIAAYQSNYSWDIMSQRIRNLYDTISK